MTVDVVSLIEQARRGDPEAGAALANLVEINLVTLFRRSVHRRGRGGDPMPRLRAERNEAAIGMALLIGAKLCLEERGRANAIAAVMAPKIARYKPAPGDDTNAGERGYLYRIQKTGLQHRFGKRTIRRVIQHAVAIQKSELDGQNFV